MTTNMVQRAGDSESTIDFRAAAPEPTHVTELPRRPAQGELFHIDSPSARPPYTHYLFRFPAKFHPPVVEWALDTFGCRGAAVLDPFTGSGTVQVEALVRGMPSVGIDVDPLACLIARAKTTVLSADALELALEKIRAILLPFCRSDTEFEALVGADIPDEQFREEAEGIWLPPVPNMLHWFRRYVLVDLGRALVAIREVNPHTQERLFFEACLASVIRRVSNADPYPVSGLEVTKVQAERNAKRVIRVFAEFLARAAKEIEGMRSLHKACEAEHHVPSARVLCGDVLRASTLLRDAGAPGEFPLVVTSPPYCTAVQYSRRHKLEMYWLGLVKDDREHSDLAHSYIGRNRVRLDDWDAQGEFGISALDRVLGAVSERNRTKGRALQHYFWSMGQAFLQLRTLLERRGVLVLAIGDSTSCGIRIPTTQFLIELAAPHFALENQFSYAVRNHYMQYPLRNGHGIRREHILVLRPR